MDPSDELDSGDSPKGKLFAAVLREPFQRLARRIRQEVLALDGATVIDHLGQVLAVGAIVHVPAGSEGGGRLAAAKRLSKLGLGIKVSSDGPITGFRDGKGILQVS